jgi:hypothetical protein
MLFLLLKAAMAAMATGPKGGCSEARDKNGRHLISSGFALPDTKMAQ